MYWPVFFKGESFCYRDFARGYFPEKLFQSRTIREGFFPFWSPWIFAGIPHHATLESQIYYPLNWISWFEPCYRFFSFNTILHLLLGGLGVTFWLRSFGVSDMLVIGGSCLWPLLGINVGLMEFFPMIAALAWLPWILGCLERAAGAGEKKERFFWLGWGGLFLGVQLLANYPTLSLYTLLVELTFLFARSKASWGKGFMNLCLIAIPGSLIYAVQLIPTRELTLLSVRGSGLSYENASEISLTFEQLRNFLFQSFAFQPQDAVPFLGIVLTFGVFLALDNLRSFWIFLCSIFWFVASFGKATPLHYLLFRFVPIFSYERKPFNLSIMALVLLFYLGITGLDSLRKIDKNVLRNLIRIIFGSALLVGVMSLVITIFREDFLLYFFGDNHDRELVVQGVRRYFLFSTAMYGLSWRILLFAGCLAAFRAWPRKIGFLFIVLAAIADPLLSMRQINPTTGQEFFKEAPHQLQGMRIYDPSARLLLAGDTYLEVVRPQYLRIQKGDPKLLGEWKNTLESRFPMIFGVADSGGNGSIIQRKYLSIIDTWNAMSASSITPSFRMLESIGTGYLVSHRKLSGDGISVLSSAPYYLYRLEKTLPRVGMFFDREKISSGFVDTLMRLNDPEFPIKERVILDEDVPFDKPTSVPEVRTRIVPSKDPNSLVVEYSSAAEGFLYVLDQMYPGWKACIDDRDVPILTGNGWMRVLKVPPGTHKVIFSFFPTGFYCGLALTLAGFFLSILLISFGHAGRVTLPI